MGIFHPVFPGDVPRGPSGVFKLFQDLFFQLTQYTGLFFAMIPSIPYTLKALTMFFVLYRALGKVKGSHGLLSGTPREQQDNNRGTTICVPVSRALGRIQPGKGCVPGIGHKVPVCHDP
jgi:hypothetical protein